LGARAKRLRGQILGLIRQRLRRQDASGRLLHYLKNNRAHTAVCAFSPRENQLSVKKAFTSRRAAGLPEPLFHSIVC
jgi:hypothetical protein